VSSGIIIDAEPKASQGPGAAPSERGAISGGGSARSWLGARLNPFLFAVMAAAFLLRLHAASGTFLNPDEPDAFVLPDLISEFTDIDLNPKLSPEEKEKAKSGPG